MRFYLIAGEPSGDRLGADLMAGLKQLVPEVEFFGIGGPLMQAQGMTSLFPMQELSIMGLVEVLPKYTHLKRRISQTATDVLGVKPDALITIDSPDFCLRVARKVRASSDIRTVHYVAPSVWAWRRGRAAKMAEVIDQVLALLPFEPPYMQAAGMRCDFVGHPIAAEPAVSKLETQRFRDREDIGDAPLVLVLPGSRKAEVTRLIPTFGQALRPVLDANPATRIVIPTVEGVASTVAQATKDWPGDPIILDPHSGPMDQYTSRKRTAFAAADIALAASGTVSLELAAAGTPMVIAYDMKWLSWQIMSRLARIDTVTLVNLVVGENVVPEYLGPDCQPAPIGAALLSLLGDARAQTRQRAAMDKTMTMLGRGQDPGGLRAARAVLEGLKQNPH